MKIGRSGGVTRISGPAPAGGSARASNTRHGNANSPTSPPTGKPGSGSSEPCGDELRDLAEGVLELRRVVAARLGEVRPPAAAAPDELGDLADERAGAHFLGSRRRDRRD